MSMDDSVLAQLSKMILVRSEGTLPILVLWHQTTDIEARTQHDWINSEKSGELPGMTSQTPTMANHDREPKGRKGVLTECYKNSTGPLSSR